MIRKLTTKGLQKQCDSLLSPIVIKLNPTCLLCPNPTQVAHHHVHKSKSLILRYNMDNLVNLCHSCHLALHMNESYHASRIVEIRGLEWFRELQKEKNKIIKADVIWYSEQLGKLRSIYNKL